MALEAQAPGIWRWGRWTERESPAGPARESAIELATFNVCGSSCNEGEVEQVAQAVCGMALDHEADVLLLNEVCLTQAGRIFDLLSDAGLMLSACFGGTTDRSRCLQHDGVRWFGNAVLCRSEGLGHAWMTPLWNRPGQSERRSVLGMRTVLNATPATVLVTHLIPRGWDAGANRRQIRELARLVHAQAASGEAVIVGGDLNVTPRRLGRMTRPGRFFDLDRFSARPTHGSRKIDYLFVDTDRFCDPACEVLESPISDHRYLRGRVGVRLRGHSLS